MNDTNFIQEDEKHDKFEEEEKQIMFDWGQKTRRF